MATRFRLLRFRTKVAIAISIVFVLVALTSFSMAARVYLIDYVVIIGGGGIDFFIVDSNYPKPSLSIKFYSANTVKWLPWAIYNAPKIQNALVMSWTYSFYIFIPLWMFAPFILIPTFLLWRKDRRATKGHCNQCGYNLTGNVSGKCSECGMAIKNKA